MSETNQITLVHIHTPTYKVVLTVTMFCVWLDRFSGQQVVLPSAWLTFIVLVLLSTLLTHFLSSFRPYASVVAHLLT